jgi:hypothetical protein
LAEGVLEDGRCAAGAKRQTVYINAFFDGRFRPIINFNGGGKDRDFMACFDLLAGQGTRIQFGAAYFLRQVLVEQVQDFHGANIFL